MYTIIMFCHYYAPFYVYISLSLMLHTYSYFYTLYIIIPYNFYQLYYYNHMMTLIGVSLAIIYLGCVCWLAAAFIIILCSIKA